MTVLKNGKEKVFLRNLKLTDFDLYFSFNQHFKIEVRFSLCSENMRFLETII